MLFRSGLKKGRAEPKTVPAKTEPPLVDMSALLAKAGGCAAPGVESVNPESYLAWRSELMADIDERSINWLWPGRIALGKLSMLAGDPGLGKSFLSCDLAARVSTGQKWPDGRESQGAGDVLLLNAEDDPADTIKPRLRAARADMKRIRVMHAVDKGRLFSLDKHLCELAACASMMPDLRLIIIDPVTAFVSGIDSHESAEVRQALTPLAELAKYTGVAVLGVGHLNKGAGSAVYRVTGSLAWTAAARATWFVLKDPQDRDKRLLLPVKNNIGNDRIGMAYAINGFSDPPFVDWSPDPEERDIDAVLNSGPVPASAAAPVGDRRRGRMAGSVS